MIHVLPLSLASFAAALLIAALLLQKTNRFSNRVLAALLVLGLLQAWLVPMLVSSARLPYPLCLVNGPLMYFYVAGLVVPGFRLKRSDLVHLLPVLFGALWLVAVTPRGFSWEAEARGIGFVAVYCVYLVGSYRLIHRYEEELSQVASGREGFLSAWLKLILYALLLLWAVMLGDVLTGASLSLIPLYNFVLAMALGAMVFFALRYSRVFSEVRHEISGHGRAARIPPEHLNELTRKLVEILEERRPYLDPDLRLSGLAGLMKLRPDQVSEIINQGLKTNFFTLMNQYRVREAQRRLQDPKSAHLSILAIALECGFNSKSSFAEAFRKSAACTPSEYRSRPLTPGTSPA